jgi:hemin uptake protein HemP
MTTPSTPMIPGAGVTHPDVRPQNTSVQARSAEAPAASPSLDSQALLQGHNAVVITHNGALYRLQNTRQGKLLLTK